MHTFKYKKHKRIFPDRWNELTQEQLLYVCKLFKFNLKQNQLLIAALKMFLNIPKRDFISIPPADFVGMVQAVSFLLEASTLTYQKLPTLKVWFRTYHGATDALTDLSFEQFFEYAETYFNQYLQTNDVQWLNLLIATLYRKPKTSFKPELVEHHARTLRRLPQHKKDAIFLFYAGCRNFLIRKFPNTFSGGQGSSQQPDGLEFSRLLATIVKSPSENASIRKLNLYEALVYIEEKIKTQQKTK